MPGIFSGSRDGFVPIARAIAISRIVSANFRGQEVNSRPTARRKDLPRWVVTCVLLVQLSLEVGCRSARSAGLYPRPDAGTIWQIYWFPGLCLGGCLSLVVLLYRFRLFQLTRQLNMRFHERLAERTRIAQELHDTLLQGFQGLMLRFQTVSDTVLSDPADAKRLMEEALERADQVLAASRSAIQGIRSAPAVERDLADTLNAMMNGLVEEFCIGKSESPSTSVTVEGQPRMVKSSVSEEVCRIAREALWNSFSHARAQLIESEIAYSAKFLRLRFRDDGIGIDSEVLKNHGRDGHWGITGMYERAKSIHGRLGVWSKPTAGTEVELTIPAYMAYEVRPSKGWFRRGIAKEQTKP